MIRRAARWIRSRLAPPRRLPTLAVGSPAPHSSFLQFSATASFSSRLIHEPDRVRRTSSESSRPTRRFVGSAKGGPAPPPPPPLPSLTDLCRSWLPTQPTQAPLQPLGPSPLGLIRGSLLVVVASFNSGPGSRSRPASSGIVTTSIAHASFKQGEPLLCSTHQES